LNYEKWIKNLDLFLSIGKIWEYYSFGKKNVKKFDNESVEFEKILIFHIVYPVFINNFPFE
jgi:hypothetical protein